MYTTLAQLKRVKACKPGFGRLLMFFGTSKDVKDQKIPLHVISLISGVEDAQWALESGLTIVPSEFEAVKAHTLVPVWKRKLADDRIYLEVRQKLRTPQQQKRRGAREEPVQALHPGYAVYEKALLLKTPQEIQEFIAEYRYTTYSLKLFEETLRWSGWYDPYVYLKYLVDNCGLYRPMQYEDEEENDQYPFDAYPNMKVQEMSKGERLAHVLKPEGTFDFLTELKTRMTTRDAQIKKEDGKFSIEITDPRAAFQAVRSLMVTDVSDLEDQNMISTAVNNRRVDQTDDWNDEPVPTGIRSARPTRRTRVATPARATANSASDNSGSGGSTSADSTDD